MILDRMKPLLTGFIVKQRVTICASALEACKSAEAVVIATEWKEFKEIPWEEVYKTMNKPAFVFDGRLIVDAPKLTKIGFKVCGTLGLRMSGL
jgi:UDPglucose 6-dehydrogenase